MKLNDMRMKRIDKIIKLHEIQTNDLIGYPYNPPNIKWVVNLDFNLNKIKKYKSSPKISRRDNLRDLRIFSLWKIQYLYQQL